MQPETKLCSKCGEVKSLAHFGKDRKRVDGLKWACKGCCNALRKDWLERNPGKMQQYRREYCERHPDVVREGKRRYKRNRKDRINEYRRAYHAAHPEKDNDRKRKWRQANPDRHRSQKRGWRERNPDKHAAARKRRFERSKERTSYAKAILRQLIGVPAALIPEGVASAKAAQLRVTRLARSRAEPNITPGASSEG